MAKKEGTMKKAEAFAVDPDPETAHCPPGLKAQGAMIFTVYKFKGWHPLLGKPQPGHNRMIVADHAEEHGYAMLRKHHARGLEVVKCKQYIRREAGEIVDIVYSPSNHLGVIVGTYQENGKGGQ